MNHFYNQSKCNIFVFYHCHSCGIDIPTFTINLVQSRAPIVAEWISPNTTIKGWKWFKASTVLPEPGWLCFDDAHCAIIDYDGAGISGGVSDNNKILYLIFPNYFRKHE